PEVLHDDIRGRGKSSEQVLTGGLAQVQGDALASPTFDGPEQGVARRGRVLGGCEGADLAHEVTPAGLFDLDDLGALLAEQPGAERRRDPGAEVEDPDALERGAHRPACLRASEASSAVAVLLTSWWIMKWYRQESRCPARSSMWLMDSLMACAVTGGTNATWSAIARAARSRSARGTTRFTSPRRWASSASMVSAQRRNSLAFRGPSSHGSISSSTPTPGMRATGFEKRASSAATMRSHMHASIRPAAAHAPCTAAMVGLRKSRRRTHRSKY